MKHNIFGFGAFLLTAFLATACNNDDCDKQHYNSMVTAEGGENAYFLSDKGNFLYPTTQLSGLKGGERALIYYHLEKEQERTSENAGKKLDIELIQYHPLLSKPIWALTAANADTSVVRSKDPVGIAAAYVGGGYLNVRFNYPSSPQGIIHYVNVVENKLSEKNTSDNDTYKVEFIHNANGDLLYGNWATGIACFRLPEGAEEKYQTIELTYREHTSQEKSIKIRMKEEEKNLLQLSEGSPVRNLQ